MKAQTVKYINISTAGYEVSDKLSFTDVMRLIKSAELSLMQNLVEQATKHSEEEGKQMKKDVYDAYNEAASSVLYLFAPELELRPDLTVEAIKKAQEAILAEATDEELVELVIGDEECIANLQNALDAEKNSSEANPGTEESQNSGSNA